MSNFYGLLIILFLFLLKNHQAQTVLINENFNQGFPSGWMLIDNDALPVFNHPAVNFIDNAFVLRDNPDNPNVGDSLLKATSWHATPGEADDYLITPQITLGTFGNYVYFDARSVDLSHPEGLEIRVSTSGTAIEDFSVLDAAYYNLTMSPYWDTYTVSLDSIGAQGQQVYVAFRHFGNDQYLLLLDNIRIETENPVGITNPTIHSITLFPNPVQNMLFIQGLETPTETHIFNIAGQLVWSGIVQHKIDTQAITPGIYTLICNGRAQKFVKL
jgi:hypothetical protein